MSYLVKKGNKNYDSYTATQTDDILSGSIGYQYYYFTEYTTTTGTLVSGTVTDLQSGGTGMHWTDVPSGFYPSFNVINAPEFQSIEMTGTFGTAGRTVSLWISGELPAAAEVEVYSFVSDGTEQTVVITVSNSTNRGYNGKFIFGVYYETATNDTCDITFLGMRYGSSGYLTEEDFNNYMILTGATQQWVIDNTSGFTSGTSGTSGDPGEAGTSGTSGSGESGTSGTSGESGTPGTEGTSGTSGADGGGASLDGISDTCIPYNNNGALADSTLFYTGPFAPNSDYGVQNMTTFQTEQLLVTSTPYEGTNPPYFLTTDPNDFVVRYITGLTATQSYVMADISVDTTGVSFMYYRASGSTFNLYLPSATATGDWITLKNVDGDITVLPFETDTIDGTGSKSTTTGDKFTFVDGAVGRWDIS